MSRLLNRARPHRLARSRSLTGLTRPIGGKKVSEAFPAMIRRQRLAFLISLENSCSREITARSLFSAPFRLIGCWSSEILESSKILPIQHSLGNFFKESLRSALVEAENPLKLDRALSTVMRIDESCRTSTWLSACNGSFLDTFSLQARPNLDQKS
jgi:hypothetical protein